MKYEIRPLAAWTDPTTEIRRSSNVFRASWPDTLNLLGCEAEKLGARLVVVQVDVAEGDIRRDGMLRANAKIGHPGVTVSFDCDIGPLRYATDAYDSWKANVRAIALGLEALRAVDRYGITRRNEQYVGFKAIAAPVTGFTSADEAFRWMRDRILHKDCSCTPRDMYRQLARRMHPDTGGDPADWERLAQALQLLESQP